MNIERLKMNGTYRQDRHGNKVNGKAIEIPKPPLHLSKEEKKIFTEIATKMVEVESLSSLDVYSLENYCIQLALCRKAKKELDKSGEYIMPYTNKAGATNLIANPWLTVLKNTNDILLKLSAKLGLSPVDRSKVDKVIKGDPSEYSLLR